MTRRNPIAKAVTRVPPKVIPNKKRDSDDHVKRGHYCYPDCTTQCTYCFDVVSNCRNAEDRTD